MKFTITPHKIVKDPRNQVTSPNILKKNQRRVSDHYAFDENGLFSRKIFGRIGKCECGDDFDPNNLDKDNICKICGCRVVSLDDMPDFFIDLGVKLPKLYCDWGKYKDVKQVLTYESFVYEDPETHKYSIVLDQGDGLDMHEFNENYIHIGLDAARLIHPDIDEWADKYMTDYISVPHTIYRPNVRMDNKSVTFSQVNKLLVEVLQNLNNIKQYTSIFDDLEDSSINYYMLSFYNEVYKAYNASMLEIFRLFSEGKSSFVGSDMRAHRVTGAIKGTVVNRYDIDEDIVLIGDTFIQTLYPYLYQKYKGDMKAINDHLIDNEERVLINRPPTICHLSIVGMKPRVASCYKLGTFTDHAIGKHEQSEYDEENDTLGIRTIGINPIIQDGLAGDYDGDTYLLIALYSKKAKLEADTMLPSKNFMNYANGNIRNGIIEDVEYIRDVLEN